MFVSTLDALSKDQIEAFVAALPQEAEANFTRYPNGYEFNVLMFDGSNGPLTADMNQVALAAETLQDLTGGSITAINVNGAQFQPTGYSEIENNDKVFASFKESLYSQFP